MPKTIRDALGVREGDTLVFRVEDGRATIAAAPDLLDLAGSISVPVDLRGLPWGDVRRRAWQARSATIVAR